MGIEQYGPLQGLIGRWQGEKGVDIAPESDGTEENAFREEIEFSPVDEVVNAEEQRLWVIQYRQQVHRIRGGKRIHDQCGYWIWQPADNTIWHTFVIPRGVSVHAKGTAQAYDQGVKISVRADESGETGTIMQTPFMAEKARTDGFSMVIDLQENQLSYEQVSHLFIYGKSFEHTDTSVLKRV